MRSRIFMAACCLLIGAGATFVGRAEASEDQSGYPAAAGFNATGSDAEAIAIADAVMEKMGGYDAWNQTRYICWSFFGKRDHVWDKWTGRTRVEFDDEEGHHYVLLSNVHTKTGHVFRDGEEVVDQEERATLLEKAYGVWVNDSYWLVMPYKLKDSGVTLTYVGQSTMEDGRDADVLRLTFEGVGVTPDNAYEVYVAKDSGLVEEWTYFTDAQDAEPRLRTAWHDWTQYGAILLSADRGEGKHSGLAVFAELPDSVFEDPETPAMPEM